MKPAEVAPGMVFGSWEILGPACPEYRNGTRFVEALCWCRVVYEVSAAALVHGKSRRCKECELGRRRSVVASRTVDSVLARNTAAERSKRARRLAMIKKAAEALA